jgi:hypothetical protein
MKISEDKSNTLTTGVGTSTIQINGNKLQQVQHFQYLGSTVDSSGTDSKSIENRIMIVSNCFGALGEIWSSKVSVKAKLKVYKSLVVPKVMYSAETLTSNYDTNNYLDIFERNG